MADWKKLVVSGSNISQLNNDAGYLTLATSPVRNAFASASHNGTTLIADSASGSLAFASGSGQGLTISANASTDTLTFGLAAVPNSSLANSAVTITAGNGLTGGGSTSLGGSSTLNIGAGTHITVNADDVAVNTTTLIPAISGSIFSQVSGDITITAGGVATIGANSVALGTDTTGDYVANITSGGGLTGGTTGEGSTPTLAVGAGTHITVNADDVAVNTTTLIPAITGSILTGISGSIYTQVSGDITITSAGVATIAANSVALGTDTTGNYVANLGAGTGVTIGSNTGEGSTPTIAVNYGSTSNTAVQGSTTISLTGTANEVEITGTTAQALGGGPSYTIGLPNDVTIGNNLTVTGDLFVNGTTTQINTTDLLVEDKFILLASGSATAGDGGIIIDRGSDAGGNVAYGFDSATGRWGFQNGITDTTNALTIGTNGNSAFVGYVFTQGAHTSAPTTGEFVQAGAIYTATSGDIYIYS